MAIDLSVAELGEKGNVKFHWKWRHYLGFLPTALSLWGRRHKWPNRSTRWEALAFDLEYDGTNGKAVSIQFNPGEWEVVVAPTRESTSTKLEALVSNRIRVTVPDSGISYERT